MSVIKQMFKALHDAGFGVDQIRQFGRHFAKDLSDRPLCVVGDHRIALVILDSFGPGEVAIIRRSGNFHLISMLQDEDTLTKDCEKAAQVAVGARRAFDSMKEGSK